jgi:uncharacterized protein YbjT (DUF2867 family)
MASPILVTGGTGTLGRRATQFHDLVLMAAQQMARRPVIPVAAGFRFQPVDGARCVPTTGACAAATR